MCLIHIFCLFDLFVFTNTPGWQDLDFDHFRSCTRLHNMASLLVELHAVVDRYIKHKELSGDIGSNVLEAAHNVVKTRVFELKNTLRYRSVKPMNILARDFRCINAMLVRRMKPTPICRSLWNVVFSRYMPKEVFDSLDEYIQALNNQNSRSETKCT